MSFLFNIFFVFLSIMLALSILIQQGKGEIGLIGGANQGGQLIFGGSGGSNFFEKLTWVLGALFIAGSLFLSLYQTKQTSQSVLQGYKVEQPAPKKDAAPQKK